MTFTVQTVSTALAPRPVRFFERVDSTNDIARQWLLEGAPAGSVVVADEQVNGRGRLGRTWHTPPGSALIVSVILHPSPAFLSSMSMLGAVAIAEMLEQAGARDTGIKWPNDVHLAGRKVCGILPEVEWENTRLVGVVLGMGVNVRTDFSNTELVDSAISIETVLGQSVSRLELLRSLLSRIDYWSQHLQDGSLFSNWKGRLNMLGQPVTIKATGLSGVAESVDEEGALHVQDANGALHRVIAGDIGLGIVS